MFSARTGFFTQPPDAAVQFDGTGDYYSTTGLTTTATDSKYLTLAMTVYLPSSASSLIYAGASASLQTGATTGVTMWGSTFQSTRLHMYFPDNSGSDTGQIFGDFEITTLDAWHQYVVYVDATSFANCKYYVDGVDRTGVLLNGPSFGEVGLVNLDFNWGSTTTDVYVANASTLPAGKGFYTDALDFPGRFAQLYAHNASGAPTISDYWNSGSNLPRDLGTTGTATGLVQPMIYHYGTPSTFPTNNGTGFNAYTLTASGTPQAAAGPIYG